MSGRIRSGRETGEKIDEKQEMHQSMTFWNASHLEM